MNAPTPAGWYPDPAGGPTLRWFDGQSWAPLPGQPPAIQTATIPFQHDTYRDQTDYPPVQASPYAAPMQSPYVATSAPAERTNRFAFITMAVVAIYVVIAVSTNFVIFGALPLVLAIRSLRAKEPLAPLAIVLALGTCLMAGLLLTTR